MFFLRAFRRFWRIPAIVFWMAEQAVIALIRFRNMPEKHSAASRIVAERMKIWARGLLKILGVRICVREGGFSFCNTKGGLLVSNHQGPLDILVHASEAGMRFAPHTGIRAWPVLGAYVNLSRPVWVDRSSARRSRAALDEFRDALRNSETLMVYPEGTTTSGAVPLLPFKSTVFQTVAGTDLPLHPVLTVYKPGPGDNHPDWSGDEPFLKHVWKILGNRRTEAILFVLPEIKPGALNRKSLAEKTRTLLEERRKRFQETGK